MLVKSYSVINWTQLLLNNNLTLINFEKAGARYSWHPTRHNRNENTDKRVSRDSSNPMAHDSRPSSTQNQAVHMDRHHNTSHKTARSPCHKKTPIGSKSPPTTRQDTHRQTPDSPTGITHRKEPVSAHKLSNPQKRHPPQSTPRPIGPTQRSNKRKGSSCPSRKVRLYTLPPRP